METDIAEFDGVGDYTGYSEIVVSTEQWRRQLPHSVEGIFLVECRPGEENLHYGGTARTCNEAHEWAVEAHQQFLRDFPERRANFPLLRLRPSNWNEPFVAHA